MDAEGTKLVADIAFAGMTKTEFFVTIGATVSAFVLAMWYMQRPILAMQIDIKELLKNVKTDKELEDQVTKIVLQHTVACEGKQLMPSVLNVIAQNSQSNKELANAISGLTHNTQKTR